MGLKPTYYNFVFVEKAEVVIILSCLLEIFVSVMQGQIRIRKYIPEIEMFKTGCTILPSSGE